MKSLLMLLLYLIIPFFFPVNGWALTISDSGPDAEALGQKSSYRVCPHIESLYKSECRIGTWSAQEKVRVTNLVRAPEAPWELPEIDSPPPIRYRWGMSTRSIDDYLSNARVTGLLIIKDGMIVAERYQYGRNPSMRMISFSMAKTFTAVLVGIAHQKGFIKSLDDPASKYWPEISESAYGQTTIRNLLRMASGVPSNELSNFSPEDDLTIWGQINNQPEYRNKPQKIHDFLNAKRTREISQGERFKYSSIETDILSRVLIKSTGKSVSAITEEWLWKPMGAEADARWSLSTTDRAERTQGDFNATLRDYGRFGMLLANDGSRDGTQIIPKEFLLDATDINRLPTPFRPGRAREYYGYGYQTWITPMKQRTFLARGLYGQFIFVQPSSKIVMVHLAAYEKPYLNQEYRQELFAVWKGVLKSLGGSDEE